MVSQMEVTGNCRFKNISYTIFRLCGMGLLPCKNPNVYLGPVSFFLFFYIAPQPQAIFQFSATELNPGGLLCHL